MLDKCVLRWAVPISSVPHREFLNVGYRLQRQITQTRRLATASGFCFLLALFFHTVGAACPLVDRLQQRILNRQAAMRHGGVGGVHIVMVFGPSGICQISQITSLSLACGDIFGNPLSINLTQPDLSPHYISAVPALQKFFSLVPPLQPFGHGARSYDWLPQCVLEPPFQYT